MITNQILTRQMGCFTVEQRTKDGMFNATALLKQWNETMLDKQKYLDDFLRNEGTQDFIKVLCDKENLHPEKNRDVKTSIDNQSVLHPEKNGDVKVALATSRARVDRGGGTWMHPFLFIKFAMWLNSEFEYEVLKFVHDKLLEYRDEAGEAYKALASSVSKIVSKEAMAECMSRLGKALNWVVYNKHESELRNREANESKLNELNSLEKRLAMLVDDGFIKSYDDLIAYMRKQYSKRWTPKVLQS